MRLATQKRYRCPGPTVLCGLLLITALASTPRADAQVAIIPRLQEMTMSRGGRDRFNLQIANRGVESLTLAMHAYGLAMTVDGVPTPIITETEQSCADWITFSPANFELAAGSVQVVEGLVRAPKDAVGGYSSFITAEFRTLSEPFTLDDDGNSQAQLSLGRAVSSILLITARSSKNVAALEPDSLVLRSGRGATSEVTPVFAEPVGEDGWQASLMVRNTGNVHTVARGEISIWREDARPVGRAELTAGRGFILPGKTRRFTAEGKTVLPDGIYLAKVHLRTQQGRLVQGSFPYSIVDGEAVPGAASDAIRELLKATAPSFSLSKRMLDCKITPGGRRTQGVTLKNHSQDTLTVAARAVDWTLNDEGRVELAPDPTILVRPCTPWLTISPNPILIPPRRSVSVKLTVTAPSELSGEYYSAVVFGSPGSGMPLPTEFELPRTVLMTVSSSRGLEYQAEIESFYHEPVSPLMRMLVVNAINTGNTHCFASGKVEVYDLKYNLVMEPIRFGGPNDFILPGKVRGYAVPCPGALDRGTYEAVVIMDYAVGVEPVISKIRFDERR